MSEIKKTGPVQTGPVLSAQGKRKILLPDQLAHVDQGIPHSSERRIDAHAGVVGNLLETHSAIVPQVNHLSLIVGQLGDQLSYIGDHLIEHQGVFNIGGRKLPVVQKIIVVVIVRHRLQKLLLAVMVYDQVMGNSQHPRKKFALVAVVALAQGSDHLDKGVLKNIFSQVGIFNNQQNVGVNPVFVSADQLIDTCLVTRDKSFYEDIIILIMYIQNYLLFSYLDRSRIASIVYLLLILGLRIKYQTQV